MSSVSNKLFFIIQVKIWIKCIHRCVPSKIFMVIPIFVFTMVCMLCILFSGSSHLFIPSCDVTLSMTGVNPDGNCVSLSVDKKCTCHLLWRCHIHKIHLAMHDVAMYLYSRYVDRTVVSIDICVLWYWIHTLLEITWYCSNTSTNWTCISDIYSFRGHKCYFCWSPVVQLFQFIGLILTSFWRFWLSSSKQVLTTYILAVFLSIFSTICFNSLSNAAFWFIKTILSKWSSK